jgi:UDP-N-acetylmuramoyl-tripeptide--D-alanyl-D-alanine ligase
VRPNVVVVTAIARDHWRSFETLEKTRDEKSEMLRILGPEDIAIMNADDENVRWMATQTRARVVWIGERPDCELRVSDIELDWPHGMRFVAHVGGDAFTVATQLMGRHMVFPALAALAVAYVEAVPMADAIKALANLTPTRGRMQIVPISNGAFAIRDDFKASIDPFEAALKAFAEVPSKRRLVVLGEVAEEQGHHVYRELGSSTGAFVDHAIFVGTSKNMRSFRGGATSAGMPAEAVSHVHNAYEATALLREKIQAGDAVLIKGRWQQALGRVALAMAGNDVKCRADPCPFKRMQCDVCPFLEQEFYGLDGSSA